MEELGWQSHLGPPAVGKDWQSLQGDKSDEN